MYTILVNDDNTLTASVRERIIQRSNLVDTLHFLVKPMYKELDMSEATVMMEYCLPVSKECHTEPLSLSDDLYKGRLEYKVPFDTNLTKEIGDIEVKLTFTKMDLDEEGNNIQRVRKTTPCSITITPVCEWDESIPSDNIDEEGLLVLLTKEY